MGQAVQCFILLPFSSSCIPSWFEYMHQQVAPKNNSFIEMLLFAMWAKLLHILVFLLDSVFFFLDSFQEQMCQWLSMFDLVCQQVVLFLFLLFAGVSKFNYTLSWLRHVAVLQVNKHIAIPWILFFWWWIKHETLTHKAYKYDYGAFNQCKFNVRSFYEGHRRRTTKKHCSCSRTNTPSKKQRMDASSGTKDAAMTAPENTIMKDANTISEPKKMIEST